MWFKILYIVKGSVMNAISFMGERQRTQIKGKTS
jgi:hypothetical protein